MASGKGSSAEPFIITTYQELTSIISNSMYAGEWYIEFDPAATNRVIDFNDVFYGEETTGISTALGSKTTWHINGNGWTIMNMVISDHIFKSFEGTIYVENLHIKNFILRNDSADSGILYGKVNLSKCTLAGITYGSCLVYRNIANNDTTISQCVINIKHLNNSLKFSLCKNDATASYRGFYVRFNDNNMKITILCAYDTTSETASSSIRRGLFSFTYLYENYIYVTIIYKNPNSDTFNIGIRDDANYGGGLPYTNTIIVDFIGSEGEATVVVSNITLSGNLSGTTLFVDKNMCLSRGSRVSDSSIDTGYRRFDFNVGNMKEVTMAQLIDSDHLSSLGYPMI